MGKYEGWQIAAAAAELWIKLGTVNQDNQIMHHPNQGTFERCLTITLGQQLYIENILEKLGHAIILVITPALLYLLNVLRAFQDKD